MKMWLRMKQEEGKAGWMLYACEGRYFEHGWKFSIKYRVYYRNLSWQHHSQQKGIIVLFERTVFIGKMKHHSNVTSSFYLLDICSGMFACFILSNPRQIVNITEGNKGGKSHNASSISTLFAYLRCVFTFWHPFEKCIRKYKSESNTAGFPIRFCVSVDIGKRGMDEACQ